jgi:hypothetical protein
MPANALPRHLGPNSLAYSLPSYYLNPGDKVTLFENAHLTSLFSTHPSIVHSLRRGVKQMRGLVSLFPWRLVLAVDGEMGCTQFHRRGRSRQDKSACVRMPRPQLRRGSLQRSEGGMAEPRSAVRTYIIQGP